MRNLNYFVWLVATIWVLYLCLPVAFICCNWYGVFAVCIVSSFVDWRLDASSSGEKTVD